jgi:hypothetical protein
MKNLVKTTLLTGVAALLLTGSANLMAQQDQGQQNRPNRGNFDPAQMRQRMMDNLRERFEVKSDDEWKIIQTRIEAVTQARRDASTMGGFGGMMGRRGQGGPGGPGAQADNTQRRGPGGFGGEPNPAVEALQKALEGKASNDELKAKMAAVRDSIKEREAKLEKAQAELKKVLSVRQEAEAMVMGLVK